ncbi:tfdA family taurine catabolism dioxygenase [Colletotrichum tofieldiae]|nr:tfdA family taurine catabolism dioxygenase [Colletotrichum tofieldiae]
MAAAAVQAPSLPGPPGQPDIAYTPNHESYLARTTRRQEQERLEKTLPEGFPQKLESKLVWDGNTLAEHYDWNYVLTEADKKEIDEALNYFKSLKKPLGEIGQETFPLPNLHKTLRAISDEIHNGHGFKVVRGVPVDKYSREENVIIYAGVSSHVAPIRGRQDNQFQGEPADVVLAHIKDLTKVVDAHRIGAPAYTTEKQVFHTDVGDVIALFALGEAAEGANGKSERLIIQYARRSFTGYWGLPRSSDIPPITEAQAEALDALHFLAEKYAASLDFHKGDIQYANNLSIFHARGGFVDSDEKQRHLIRLWLRDPENAWTTPEALKERWERVYSGVTPEKSVFPLEPQIRSVSRGEFKPEENVSSVS